MFSVGLRHQPPESDKGITHTTVTVGELGYTNGQISQIRVPIKAGAITYNVNIFNQQVVQGLYLASHRSASNYQQVNSIPSNFSTGEQILNQFVAEMRQRYSGGAGRSKSAQLLMKEALLAAAIYGEGSASVYPNHDARRIWRGFQEVLRSLMPETLRFERLVARPPEIVIETASGSFPLDSISGGMSALFEIGWQIFLRSQNRDAFTVCIDEPENHLHPSLQRTLVPSLLRAFPRVNFVLATHSPFVVTASATANVHVLSYDEDSRVFAEQLDFSSKAATAETTLREALGMTSTLPLWAENRFDEIIDRYLHQPPDSEHLLRLRNELRASGLDVGLPEAIERIARNAVDDEIGPIER